MGKFQFHLNAFEKDYIVNILRRNRVPEIGINFLKFSNQNVFIMIEARNVRKLRSI